MITKAQIKFIQSLARQKYRKENNVFLVEGEKNVQELLNSNMQITQIFGIKEWKEKNIGKLNRHPSCEFIEVAQFELEKISALTTAQQVLAIVKKSVPIPFDPDPEEWLILIEKIQDPGNMGTIIRTADWFGITKIILSPDCVEIYNPKVVQATMGSLFRMNFYEMEINEIIEVLQIKNLPLYAACLNGKSIFDIRNAKPGIIAVGNESEGLSAQAISHASEKVFIPGKGKAESLNVGVATGIICAYLVGS